MVSPSERTLNTRAYETYNNIRKTVLTKYMRTTSICCRTWGREESEYVCTLNVIKIEFDVITRARYGYSKRVSRFY